MKDYVMRHDDPTPEMLEENVLLRRSIYGDCRIQVLENRFRDACTRARAKGVVLVTGDFQVDGPVIGLGTSTSRRVVGCCAWGAMNLYQPTKSDASHRSITLEDEEYNAIEQGWDGDGEAAAMAGKAWRFWRLGAKLAAEFQPVPASSLEQA